MSREEAALALAELLRQLRREGDVSPSWLALNAPDGIFQPRWDACDAPLILLALGGAAADPHDLVRCACACAERAVNASRDGTNPFPRGLEAATAWLEGRATPADLDAARLLDSKSSDEEDALQPIVRETKRAIRMALAAARAASRFEVRTHGASHSESAKRELSSTTSESARSAARVVAAVAYDDPEWSDAPCDEALAEVAAIVRRLVPCPSIDALRRVYAAR